MASIAIPPVFVIFTIIPEAFSPIIFYIVPFLFSPLPALHHKAENYTIGISSISELDKCGYYRFGPQTPGMPNNYGVSNAARFDANFAACMTITQDGRMHIATQTGGIWHDHTQIATATKPEEHDLPLAAELTTLDACSYRKTQDGRVSAEIGFKRLDATMLPSIMGVCAFPLGYRPKSKKSRHLTTINAAGKDNGEARLEIYADGHVDIVDSPSGSYGAYGHFDFWAD